MPEPAYVRALGLGVPCCLQATELGSELSQCNVLEYAAWPQEHRTKSSPLVIMSLGTMCTKVCLDLFSTRHRMVTGQLETQHTSPHLWAGVDSPS